MLVTARIPCPGGVIFDAARAITEQLTAAGFPTRWVGGAVRDICLHRAPGDIDMVTTALPGEVLELFPDSELVGASFGVVLVKAEGMSFELATCREERCYMDGRHPGEVKFTDDFSVDVLRRDLTVNAMLYDPVTETVFDYTGGLEDLRNGIIRMVGEPLQRLSEDYLRIFRAVRFASRLGFEIEKSTLQALKIMAPESRRLAPERVRNELDLMLTSETPAAALQILKNIGVLKVWLPEVDALAGVEQAQVYHPEGDVWEHTLLMFRNLAKPASASLAWSILLHDIGKKPTFRRDADNIPHFYCHESVGADMIPAIAERLRFSRHLTEVVIHAVRNHMRMASVREMRPAKLRRLLSEPEIAMEIELHRLDCCSSNGLMETWAFLCEQLKKYSENGTRSLPPPLINGEDLIAWGYKPGREFKIMLDTIFDAQLEQKITVREEAENLLKKLFPSK